MSFLAIMLSCFLFFCSAPVKRHVPKQRSSCDTVLLAYASRAGSRDEFVGSFPARKQRRVLQCIGDE